jgi:hypothetical protein
VLQGISLDPAGVYDDGALYNHLGLTAATLSRARRSGRLRFTKQGKRILYLGEWVTAWLRAEGQPRPEAVRAE